ncbi:DNA alkylation repair protein [Bacteroidota bacterium]
MIHPYLKPLINKYESNRNQERAVQMKKYMKDQFEFYGIGTPDRRAMMSAHIREYGLPDWSDIEAISRSLWEMDERECQFTQLDLMNRMKKKLRPENLSLLEYLITTKSWWDTVDGLAGWFVGELFKRHPELIKPTTERWMKSGDIWLQRSCLLFQLKYKKDTDLDLLFSFISALSDHKSFWIRKAIGWILREYSKTDPQAVKDYVDAHPELSGLSKREALKVINRAKDRN